MNDVLYNTKQHLVQSTKNVIKILFFFESQEPNYYNLRIVKIKLDRNMFTFDEVNNFGCWVDAELLQK